MISYCLNRIWLIPELPVVTCHVESQPGELDSWYWEENGKPILVPLMVKEYYFAFNWQPKKVNSCSWPHGTNSQQTPWRLSNHSSGCFCANAPKYPGIEQFVPAFGKKLKKQIEGRMNRGKRRREEIGKGEWQKEEIIDSHVPLKRSILVSVE